MIDQSALELLSKVSSLRCTAFALETIRTKASTSTRTADSGMPKREIATPEEDGELTAKVRERALEPLREAVRIPTKAERYSAISEIEGTVLDATTQKPMARAWVQAVSEDGTGGNRTWHGVNGKTGGFRLFALPPGSYTVRARADNYVTFERQGVTISANQPAKVDIQLQPR